VTDGLITILNNLTYLPDLPVLAMSLSENAREYRTDNHFHPVRTTHFPGRRS
jgi:hypothetical protein